ncbi:cystathionine beta-lyase [Siculibacillus lacustris]|uniref:Cystathionine beta-lyase n=1 Tax=Siculibacillus lacustris TaxID=1549641 RepID=A0A4Q9VFF3_9HYPH|nr:cystathionine beta-lyase [Siculibacillus lacustris]TBW33636.1 cystathionine beta-lyase [Siculibacillus lacustris]
MSVKSQTPAKHAVATRLAHLGRGEAGSPFVNPPVIHASTVLFDSVAQIEGRAAKPAKWTYGRRGTPTSQALESAIAELEGAEGTVITPSGASACALALMAVLAAGDHLLMIDTVYGPTRNFCNGVLARFGVETTFFDPLIGAGIAALIRPNTRAIFLESPGSLTFEMPDVPAITAVARAHDILTLIDNTWATPLFFRPLDHGVDVSILAATKYVVGHSDAMVGTISAGPRAWTRVKSTHGDFGQFTGPDDMYLALRGLRTMAVRLAHHQASTLRIAEWLAGRPEVERVLYPALPSDPGHAVWKRDFKGASGLFGFILRPAPARATEVFLDDLELFGLGFSWGGFESLATAPNPRKVRTAVPWTEPGQLIRLQIGLEDPDDLIADLAAGLDRFTAAS